MTKTPKDSDSSDSSLLDIPSPEEHSRPLCQSPSPPERRPNQTAHLIGTQHQSTHFVAHLGNMSLPLKLLQQQDNVLHQQAKAKVQGTHSILTINSISTLHKIEMVYITCLTVPPLKFCNLYFLAKLAKL